MTCRRRRSCAAGDDVVEVLLAPVAERAEGAIERLAEWGQRVLDLRWHLIVELSFLDHILATSGSHRLHTDLPAAVHALARDAVTAGHGADSFSRIVDVIRLRTQTEPADVA